MRWVPTALRAWWKRKIKGVLFGGTPPVLIKYFPYKPWSQSYMITESPEAYGETGDDGLPVPPKAFWCGYGGGDPEKYLRSGKEHVDVLREVLADSAFDLREGYRVLDFGCAGGRMIRRLVDRAGDCEIWGVDISAEHIYWCKAHLSPPFHFATTTTLPHLPFHDEYFDLIYAGSVFTHIDDLTDAWLLELRRILKPEGRFYCTIHDNHTMALLDGPEREFWLADMLRNNQHYRRHRDKVGMLVVGRDTEAQVFYDRAHFKKTLEGTYHILSVTEEAYRFQTAILAIPRTS